MTTLCRLYWPRELVTLLLTAAMTSIMSLAASGSALADPDGADWNRLRSCESRDHYDLDTRNGYFGAYQFNLRTWRGVGGDGYPHEASPAEQDYRALYLYRMRGWSPWPLCVRKLGLIEDDDAHSMCEPSYEESGYISSPQSRRDRCRGDD